MEQDFDLNIRINKQSADQALSDLGKGFDDLTKKAEDLGNSADQSFGKINEGAENTKINIQGVDQAFQAAFNSLSSGLSSSNKGLSDLFRTAGQGIGTIRQVSSALKGIKLASWIGIVIVAVQGLIKYWDQFLDLVGVSKEQWKEWKDTAVDNIIQVGAKIVGVLGSAFTPLMNIIKNLFTAGKGLSDVFFNLFSGNFRGAKDVAAKAGAEIVKNFQQSFNFKQNFESISKDAEKVFRGWATAAAQSSKEGGKAVVSEWKEVLSSIEQILKSSKVPEELKKYFRNLIKPETPMAPFQELLDKFLEASKYTGTKISQALIDDIVNGQEIINKQAEDLDQARVDNLKASGAEEIKVIEETNKAKERALENQIALQEQLLEAYKNNISSLDPTLLEQTQNTLDILKTQLDTIKKEGRAAVEKAEQEIEDAELEERAKEIERVRKAREFQLKYEAEIQQLENELALNLSSLGPRSLKDSFTDPKDILETQYNLQKEALENQKRLLTDLQNETTVEGSQEWKELALDIQDVTNRLELLDKQKEALDFQRQVEQVQILTDALNSLGDIFGIVADAQEDSLRRRVESEEISKEMAEEEFERTKGFQYAQTWINTLAGMMAAFSAPTLQGKGWTGWVAAALQAASVLATGIATTIKIKNTNPFSNGTDKPNVPSPANVGVTPLDVKNDIQPSPSMLPNSQNPQDTRVYILQSDLEASRRQVEIRENNSTF